MSAAIIRLGRWRPDHFTEGKGSGSGGSPCPAADSWVTNVVSSLPRLGPRRSYDHQQEQRENLFAKYTLYMHYTINYYSSLSKNPIKIHHCRWQNTAVGAYTKQRPGKNCRNKPICTCNKNIKYIMAGFYGILWFKVSVEPSHVIYIASCSPPILLSHRLLYVTEADFQQTQIGPGVWGRGFVGV